MYSVQNNLIGVRGGAGDDTLGHSRTLLRELERSGGSSGVALADVQNETLAALDTYASKWGSEKNI